MRDENLLRLIDLVTEIGHDFLNRSRQLPRECLIVKDVDFQEKQLVSSQLLTQSIHLIARTSQTNNAIPLGSG